MFTPLCLALPLLLGVFQDELPAPWKVLTSKDGDFAAAFPGSPIEKKQRVKTATGELEVAVFVLERKDDSIFVVSYSDMPLSEVKTGTEEKRLDFAREGAVSNARGKLRSEKKIDMDGFPGRELVIETEKDIVIRMRVFAVRQRLYQAMAMGPGRFYQSKDAGTFLDSLRLIR
jgi:hypothetical protein